MKTFKNLNQKNRGFTLVELLISVSLLALVVGLSSDIIISLVRTNTKTQVANEVEQESNFIMLKLQNEIKNAVDVEGGGNSITIYKKDGSSVIYSAGFGNPPTLSWDTSTDAPTGPMPLTDVDSNKGVSITCPGTCFTLGGGGLNPTMVSVNFKLEQTQTADNPIFRAETIIEDTFIVRGTY
mgnify:CR=1 FL=1